MRQAKALEMLDTFQLKAYFQTPFFQRSTPSQTFWLLGTDSLHTDPKKKAWILITTALHGGFERSVLGLRLLRLSPPRRRQKSQLTAAKTVPLPPIPCSMPYELRGASEGQLYSAVNMLYTSTFETITPTYFTANANLIQAKILCQRQFGANHPAYLDELHCLDGLAVLKSKTRDLSTSLQSWYAKEKLRPPKTPEATDFGMRYTSLACRNLQSRALASYSTSPEL
eukprot:5720119-Amphidinium_carterae.2